MIPPNRLVSVYGRKKGTDALSRYDLWKKRCNLYVFASSCPAACVEAAHLLIDDSGDWRTVMTHDHHNGVRAGTIKRTIPVAENHRAVHRSDGPSGRMSGERSRPITGRYSTCGIKNQGLGRHDPPHAI